MPKRKEMEIIMSDPAKAPEAKTTAHSDLTCPHCGSHRFHVADGLVKWCASCGATACVVEGEQLKGWAYANEEVAARSREYVKNHRGGLAGAKAHQDTPACTSHVPKAGGDTVCGARNWQHDGEKLLYCRKCGANFKGPQPKNVAEIIATLGRPAPTGYDAPAQPRKFEQQEIENVRSTKGPGVNAEEFRAHA